jgi:hypothetical protein
VISPRLGLINFVLISYIFFMLLDYVFCLFSAFKFPCPSLEMLTVVQLPAGARKAKTVYAEAK